MRYSFPIALACTALAALGGCSTSEATAEDPALVLDRVWLDSRPTVPTDYAQAAYLVPDPSVGLFQRASAYEMRAELFEYRRDGRTLALTFPQTGKTARVSFTVTACRTLPPFDLCLDLSENPWGGPKRYFGMRSQDEDDATLRGMKARLPGR
jgi:hypothetical protein